MSIKIMDNLIKSFILGGNALFTIKSNVTGNYYTYRVRRSTKKPNIYIIYLQAQQSTYCGYFSIYNKSISYYRPKEKSTFDQYSKQIIALLWTVKNSTKLSGKVDVFHEGRCACCGRKLTDPTSIERGIGPDCYRKLNQNFILERIKK